MKLELETTPAMRARQRELSKQDGMDDYDRVTIMLLGDLDKCLAYLAALAPPKGDVGELVERLRARDTDMTLDAADALTAANARIKTANARAKRLEAALLKLITHTLDCEKRLDECHGLGNDAGSGMSSAVCDALAALGSKP